MTNPDIKTLLEQEAEIQFDFFNNQSAWELGNLIKTSAEALGVSVAIEVYAFEHVLFCYLMPGTNKDNHEWIKRKRQSVMRFGHSSFYLGQHYASQNRNFETVPYIDPKEYGAHGGSFPIRIKNSGIVGAVTVSGLPQETDHQLAIDALRQLINRN